MSVGSNDNLSFDELVQAPEGTARRELTEQEKAALESEILKIREMLGNEEFYKLTIRMAEIAEDRLRKNFPDCQALKLLDEHRARQEQDPE